MTTYTAVCDVCGSKSDAGFGEHNCEGQTLRRFELCVTCLALSYAELRGDEERTVTAEWAGTWGKR